MRWQLTENDAVQRSSYSMLNHISEKLMKNVQMSQQLTRISLNQRDMQVHLNRNMLQTRSATSWSHQATWLQTPCKWPCHLPHERGSSASFARIGSLSSFVETWPANWCIISRILGCKPSFVWKGPTFLPQLKTKLFWSSIKWRILLFLCCHMWNPSGADGGWNLPGAAYGSNVVSSISDPLVLSLSELDVPSKFGGFESMMFAPGKTLWLVTEVATAWLFLILDDNGIGTLGSCLLHDTSTPCLIGKKQSKTHFAQQLL